MTMIEIKNIQKTYGEKLAADIPELKIEQGEILGLVGNNGAGKSTLFRLILDLIEGDKESNGCITNNGVNVHETEEWKDWTGAFLDDSFLIDYLTPEEFFEFIAKICGMTMHMDTLMEKYARFMGGEVLGQKKLIRNLSAGNRQKVGIVAAMMMQPKVLILDEPFNFLDPSSQNALKQLITEYNKETQATILVSSHNLQHTVEISSRITLMEQGRIIRDLANDGGKAMEELNEYFG